MHDYEKAIYIKDDEIVYLGLKENLLLNMLLENKNKIVFFRDIAKEIYKENDYNKVFFKIKLLKNAVEKKTNIEIITIKKRGFIVI